MIAFKGFRGDGESLKSVMGNGIKEKCTFEPGKTYIEEESKTVSCGFHCCENPFECLTYYSFNRQNRFFRIEAAGDIDEDEQERIACTQITLLEELTPVSFAYYGLRYMVEHPDREKWQQRHGSVQVLPDEAEGKEAGHIAIARGRTPRVRGVIGSVLGLIAEDEEGIQAAKLLNLNTNRELVGKWLGLDEEGRVIVCETEID